MAESKKDTRSSITTVKLQLKEYKAIDTYETKSKLPSGQYLLGRMIHLCQPVSKEEKQISKNDARKTVAIEMRLIKVMMILEMKTQLLVVLP